MIGFHRRRFLAGLPLVLLVVRRNARGETKTSVITSGRDAKDARWFGGEARVTTAPSSIWVRLQEVEKWPSIFSDILKADVKKKDGQTWKVEIKSKTFDCGEHTWEVRALSNRTMEMSIGAPGIKARGVAMSKDGKAPADAIVSYWLFVEVTGPVGWFVSEADLRSKQERHVISNLKDMVRVFGANA